MDGSIEGLPRAEDTIDCVFCRIVDGSGPAERVFEDDHVIAFLDIRPISRGHTLVIPRRHCADLTETDVQTAGRVFAVAYRIAVGMRRPPVAANGVNIAINDGRAAFQTVFHSHIHVVPRWKRDRLRVALGFVTRRPGDSGRIGAELRAALAPDTGTDANIAREA